MSSYGTGVIEIPLDEFWAFVRVYHEHHKAEVFYGVPRVDVANDVLVIDYMHNGGTHPSNEVGFEQSKCKLQWDELKAKQQ